MVCCVCQADFAPKAVRAEPSGAVELLRRSLSWVCTRGRRLDDNVPNQDDFVLLQTYDRIHGRHLRDVSVCLMSVWFGSPVLMV